MKPLLLSLALLAPMYAQATVSEKMLNLDMIYALSCKNADDGQDVIDAGNRRPVLLKLKANQDSAFPIMNVVSVWQGGNKDSSTSLHVHLINKTRLVSEGSGDDGPRVKYYVETKIGKKMFSYHDYTKTWFGSGGTQIFEEVKFSDETLTSGTYTRQIGPAKSWRMICKFEKF